MPRFRVPIVRTAYAYKEFVVEADDVVAAEAKAMELAPSEEWPSPERSEYDIDGQIRPDE